METKKLVSALAMSDWHGVSIGDKALIQAAIERLGSQDETISGQEQTISDLEHQIRKQAQTTAAPESAFKAAFEVWQDKTEWVQKDRRFDVLLPWGKHRADVLREYIEHLESLVASPQPGAVPNLLIKHRAVILFALTRYEQMYDELGARASSYERACEYYKKRDEIKDVTKEIKCATTKQPKAGDEHGNE